MKKKSLKRLKEELDLIWFEIDDLMNEAEELDKEIQRRLKRRKKVIDEGD